MRRDFRREQPKVPQEMLFRRNAQPVKAMTIFETH
jgi:hypothetical protein